MLLGKFIKLISGFFFSVQTLYHSDSRHVLMYIGIYIGCFFADKLPSHMIGLFHQKDPHCHEGQGTQGGQGQPPVLDKHDHQYPDNGEGIGDDIGDGLGKHILKGIYVTDDPCQYLSAGAAVKKCKGKGLDMFIYILANG